MVAKKDSKTKKSVASIAVDRLIEKIEGANDAVMPWQKPYKGGCMNWFSGRPYKGLNLFLLYGGSGEYITFKQLKEYNEKVKGDFQIKKGTKSEIVIFNQVSKKMISEALAKEMIKKGNGRYIQKDEDGNYYKAQFTWRYYNVFDIKNIENSKGETLPSKLSQNKDDKEHKKAKEVIKTYMDNAQVKFKENSSTTPYYTHVGDYISIPAKERYVNNASYYSVIFHELAHSTGIKTRLNRKCFYDYHKNKEERGMEELIAEVGASLLMSECEEGLDEVRFENSLNYVGAWCSWMADNPEEVLRGIMSAEKASEYILEGGKKKEKDDKEKEVKEKKSLDKVLKELFEASNNNKQRGKRTWDRILKNEIQGKFIDVEKNDPTKFTVVKMVNDEPLLSLKLNENMRILCGMTFALIINEKDEYKLLYSIERGNTIEEAAHESEKLKIKSLHDLTYYMNLRRKI